MRSEAGGAGTPEALEGGASITTGEEPEMKYYCGVDIGGTFTDCVVLDDAGAITQSKVSTTPEDLSAGFLDAIRACAAQLGLTGDQLLGQTDLLLHGTTVGTNILVQMRGARAGLITTRGHRDVLTMMRSFGRSAGLPIDRLLHVSRHKKPAPIIPPSLIKEVTERVDWEGDVVAPLAVDEVRVAVEELLAAGVEAIAVSFLWGFVNPAHEQAVKAMIREMAPDVFVSCAHELIGKPGEYERTAAAAVNAYIGPATASYLTHLDAMTKERSYQHPLLIMHASGGVAPVEATVQAPLFTIGSGPVGGLAGTAFLARQMGHRNVIATDMGGTSFDVGVLHQGVPLTSAETVVNQYTFFMPRLDIESIGAGGGSIIWRDGTSGTLRVGPESAQAQPGPACYGRGGVQPTVTDANVVLGYFGEGAVLSGGLELDRDAALRAMRTVAEPLGMTEVEAAAGAKRIVDSHMAGLMRQLTVERGLDPRDFLIYAYGGAAGLHASSYARELGIGTVVVPLGNLASGWSALGVVDSDLLHVFERADLMSAPFDPERINAHFSELEAEARAQLAREGVADEQMVFDRSADMKFALQIHQVEVPVPGGELSGEGAEQLASRFIERYEQVYGAGSAFSGAGIQLGVLRVRARGRTSTPALSEAAAAQAAAPVGKREAYWPEAGAFVTTDVYDGRTLGRDARFGGPAIVEYSSTIVLVHPGQRGEVDRFGSLVVTDDR